MRLDDQWERTLRFSVPVSLHFFSVEKRKHWVTMLIVNHQKHLSEPKLHFPWSYVVHSYVPLPLGKFQYPLTSAALGLSEQLQTCSSTVRKKSPKGLFCWPEFWKVGDVICIFSEEDVRTVSDHSTPLLHPSSEFCLPSRHQVQLERFIQINLQIDSQFLIFQLSIS